MGEPDTSRSECHIYVRREGLASAVGHDVKLVVGRHTVVVGDGPSVRGEFEATSVRVVGALDGNRLKSGGLSATDRSKIEKHIRGDVLHVARYPWIRFQSTSVDEANGGYRIEGELTLHGLTKPLTVFVVRGDGKLIGRAAIHQPDFNIKPFKAFFGALRVKPDVAVEISIPVTAAE